jgi:predicted metal-dependent peptidase
MIRDKISKILQKWYLMEPPMFRVLCAHDIQENDSIKCPVRCGLGRLEYNPGLVCQMTDQGLEQALRAEAVRILLKHPYQRKPEGCSQQAVSVGSDLVISDNYSNSSFRLDSPKDYDLQGGMPYEWYSRQIQSRLTEESAGGGKADKASERLSEHSERNRDLSELWGEDELSVAMIDGIINSCEKWGTLPGRFVEQLKASAKARINWRNILSGFRASILSSQRKLTRMRPNRRTGFQNMGSIRRFTTKVLVAVDVSGSISSQSLSYFYGVVNSAFRYGFEAVDLIQFDHGIRVVQSLKKVVRETAVLGRGGTSFQEPIDYAHRNGYDGLVILTDGFAPRPSIPDGMKCKIIWVCQDKRCYDYHHSWMEQTGRVCTIELK